MERVAARAVSCLLLNAEGYTGPIVQTNESLADLTATVRRVLRARTADAELVEDLTQETLLKVVAAQPRLEADALRAYAIVTARNALVEHYRRQATSRRHAHRLVDYRGLAGPEQLTLEREETDALAEALDHLDPQDRQLLVAHEAEGESLDQIAEREHVTTRSVASRLARARAQLRVEFVLAFRNVAPIPARCRNTLMALSMGDRRRQEELGAAEHVATCPTCSQLSKPIVQRRRGIALWLTAFADATRRLWRLVRSHRTVQAAVAATVAATAVGVYAVSTHRAAPHDPAAVAPAVTSTATSTPP